MLSTEYIRLFYLISILYEVIGEPLLLGAVQSIKTFMLSIEIIGLFGWFGFFAANIDTEFE